MMQAKRGQVITANCFGQGYLALYAAAMTTASGNYRARLLMERGVYALTIEQDIPSGIRLLKEAGTHAQDDRLRSDIGRFQFLAEDASRLSAMVLISGQELASAQEEHCHWLNSVRDQFIAHSLGDDPIGQLWSLCYHSEAVLRFLGPSLRSTENDVLAEVRSALRTVAFLLDQEIGALRLDRDDDPELREAASAIVERSSEMVATIRQLVGNEES